MERACRSCYAALVVEGCTCGTNARGYNQETFATSFTDCSSFFRGSYNAVHTSFFSQFCQRDYLFSNSVFIVQITKLLVVHTSENGNSNQFRSRFACFFSSFTNSFHCFGHHFFAANRVHVHHICAQIAKNGQSVSYGVRNILQFQVQENFLALFFQEANHFTANCIVQFHTYFVMANGVTQFQHAFFSLLKSREIKRNYQAIIMLHFIMLLSYLAPF